MSKFQKWSVVFCFLSVLSFMLGQATRTSLAYAPLVAFLAGYILTILAAINAYKALEFSASKYQKWTVAFCFLSVLSFMLGQATRAFLADAPFVAFLAGYIFTILAAINAFKAYGNK